MKAQLANYILIILIAHTLVYSTLYYLDVKLYTGFLEVLSVPILGLYYVLKSNRVDGQYLLVLLAMLMADVINTFFLSYANLSILLYGIVSLYYAYLIYRVNKEYSLKKLTITIGVYMILYLIIIAQLFTYLSIDFGSILFYNFCLGVFVVLSWMNFTEKKSTENYLLIASSTLIVLLSIAFAFDKYVTKTKIIDAYIINILFLAGHSCMTFFKIRKEKVVYYYKNLKIKM
ncbi:hypothetical protein ACG2LH_11940 [Zhouia sp. PK063]|uniref:hypothetical protein n=1 Tax=Zhouia sp. PK063 TaxID=3373602 RepID=UPI0037A6B71C